MITGGTVVRSGRGSLLALNPHDTGISERLAFRAPN
jgi:hypothetical protein